MILEDNPLFEITSSDHTWRIYADGRIEGFPEGCKIVSYIPVFVRQAVLDYNEAVGGKK